MESSIVEYTPTIKTQNGTKSTPVSLFIPSNLIHESVKNPVTKSSTTTQRAGFIYYKENIFFPSKNTIYNVRLYFMVV